MAVQDNESFLWKREKIRITTLFFINQIRNSNEIETLCISKSLIQTVLQCVAHGYGFNAFMFCVCDFNGMINNQHKNATRNADCFE